MEVSLLTPAMLETLVRLAGAGQLVLVAASPAIPRVLGWREEMARGVRPLTRQVFWTWAAYVWLTHMAFGLLSTFGARLLLDRTPLARLVATFIATWWGARVVIQFTYLDRSAASGGALFRLAEAGLVSLFVALAAIYGAVAFNGLARG
jgi:hypothetical protein